MAHNDKLKESQLIRDPNSDLGLCQYCFERFSCPALWKSLLDGKNSPSGWGELSSIDRASQLGCTFCGILLQIAHQALGSTWPSEQKCDTSVLGLWNEQETQGLQVLLGLRVSFRFDFQSRRHDFYAHTVPGDPANDVIQSRDIDPIVDSDASWKKARDWLEDCVDNHQICWSETPRLPTRVIDVSQDASRLLISNGLRGKYAALSYCWGDHRQPLKTTTANIHEYTKFLDITVLPKTLQDAVKVTRELNLQYLWVDSLCIVQDDRMDKRKEIANMRNIYQNSYITIVAASGTTVEDGFLEPRSVPPPAALWLPYPCESGELGNLYLRWTQEYVQFEEPTCATEQRAWTLEERVLSLRRLLYTPTGLRWSCAVSEDSHGGHAQNRYPHAGIRFPRQLPARKTAPLLDCSSDEPRILWQDIVEAYSGRAVTKPRDRLLAFGGIAEEFALQFNTGEYLAGLWKNHLFAWLLWSSNSPATARRNNKAPSWSWVSIDVPVFYSMPYGIDGLVSAVEILQSGVTLIEETAPYGDILAASLVVRARYREAGWNPIGNLKDSVSEPQKIYNCLFDLTMHNLCNGTTEDADMSVQLAETAEFENEGFYVKIKSFQDKLEVKNGRKFSDGDMSTYQDANESISGISGAVVCIEVANYINDELTYGLILIEANKTASGSRDRQYRRIGTFCVNEAESDVEFFEGYSLGTFIII